MANFDDKVENKETQMSSRLADIKKYHSLYRIYREFEPDKCVYCDFGMQCYDHVPPISICESLDVEKYKEVVGDFILVPSCLKCNSLLGSFNSRNYYERLVFLRSRYEKRLRRYTAWTVDEVNEMGDTLRSLILNEKYKRDELENRLSGIMKNICSNKSFPHRIFKQ